MKKTKNKNNRIELSDNFTYSALPTYRFFAIALNDKDEILKAEEIYVELEQEEDDLTGEIEFSKTSKRLKLNSPLSVWKDFYNQNPLSKKATKHIIRPLLSKEWCKEGRWLTLDEQLEASVERMKSSRQLNKQFTEILSAAEVVSREKNKITYEKQKEANPNKAAKAPKPNVKGMMIEYLLSNPNVKYKDAEKEFTAKAKANGVKSPFKFYLSLIKQRTDKLGYTLTVKKDKINLIK